MEDHSTCDNCPQFREVSGKLKMLLWILGLGLSSVVVGLIWANTQLSFVRGQLMIVNDLSRRVGVVEEKVDTINAEQIEIRTKLNEHLGKK